MSLSGLMTPPDRMAAGGVMLTLPDCGTPRAWRYPNVTALGVVVLFGYAESAALTEINIHRCRCSILREHAIRACPRQVWGIERI
jgi:hypothetical protein